MPAKLRDYPSLALKRARHHLSLAWSAREAQAILASYPKSGRTWLRFILSSYLREVHAVDLDVDLVNMFTVIPNMAGDDQRGVGAWRQVGRRNGVPLMMVAHEPYSRTMVRALPVVFLVRNPLDVLVSSYFHRSRHRQQFAGDVAAFLRDERYGVPAFVAYHNAWGAGLAGHRHLVVSYEDLHADARASTGRIVTFLGWPLNELKLATAVRRSSFEQMRELEQTTLIPGHSYDVQDVDSRRMRKGKVGGYGDVLGDDECLTIAAMLRTDLTPDGKKILEAYSAIWQAPADPSSADQLSGRI